MKRLIAEDLKDLLSKSNRKPVVIRGARQVGKTWLVRDFAEKEGFDLVEVNFERNPELADLFSERSPAKILQNLERVKGVRIKTASTVLFLDEIQKAPAAFANLRWFYEECPELRVVATGSLLDFVLRNHDFSMPVGRISYLFMEPMSFSEFLLAESHDVLVDFLTKYSLGDEIQGVVHQKLLNLFYAYVFVGGMPEAVGEWIVARSPIRVSETHHSLINTYIDDFNKYGGETYAERMRKIMLSVPNMTGEKFKYSKVDRNDTSAALKLALERLTLSRICHKITHSSARGVPLQSQENDKYFKLMLLDTGLLATLSGLVFRSENDIGALTQINKGGIAEQVVGQMLRNISPRFIDPHLNYYVREKKGASSEVDYVLQLGNDLVPIEVKSGTTGTLKSLHVFMAERNFKKAVRINADKSSITHVNSHIAGMEATSGYELISLPFYLTEEVMRLML